jgi:chromosome segregation ATPase
MLVNSAAAEAVSRAEKLEITISDLKGEIEQERNKVVDAEMKTVQAERARDMHRDALLAHKDELASEKRKRLELTRAHRALIAEEEDRNRTIASLESKMKDNEGRLGNEQDMVKRLQEERQETEKTLQKSSVEWLVFHAR